MLPVPPPEQGLIECPGGKTQRVFLFSRLSLDASPLCTTHDLCIMATSIEQKMAIYPSPIPGMLLMEGCTAR